MRRGEKRKLKQQEAAERQEAREARPDRQQLQLLIGRGHGNCKEAVELAEKLED